MPSLVGWVIFGSLILASGILGYRALTVRKVLKNRMGPVNWDFSVSWASTFTIVGAFLGTILGESGVVPETTLYLPNGAYGALNLLFGLITLLAPLLYAALRKVEYPLGETGLKEPQYQGTVWSFLLASDLTLWAVIGELTTIFLLLKEIQVEGDIPPAVIALIGVLVCAGIILVSVHVSRGSYWIVKYQTDEENREVHKKKLVMKPGFRSDVPEAEVEAPLPPWSVF